MTTSTTTDVTINTAAVLAELGLPPTATVRDVRRAGAARVILAHVASLLERAVLEEFRYLELPPNGWSFDGALPSLEEAEGAVEAAEWRDAASASSRQLCDAAMFELWQVAPHLARAIGLMASAQRQAVREHDTVRGQS